MPGYFLWKSIVSVYLKGCLKTAKLFGFKNAKQLANKIDYDIPCKAADYVDLFVKQY